MQYQDAIERRNLTAADVSEPRSAIGAVRSVIAGSIGNLIEWYDLFAYTAFSIYFAKAFFPGDDATVQLLNTAGIFALGFLVRPIGGWVMGAYADLRGRRAAMTLSVLMMSIGSLAIALCPTYSAIGIAAPVILLVARLLQGFSVGGEYGTSATYLSEVAPARHRGFCSSFQYVTLMGGQLVATSLLLLLQKLILTSDELEAWGWRIPFALGALGAVLAFFLRRRMHETLAVGAESARVARAPLRALFQHPRAVLIVVGLTIGGTVAAYTYTIYMPRFLVNTVQLSRDTATSVSFGSLLIFTVMQPLFGALSDRVGRRPLLITFGVLGSIGSVPLLTALSETRDAFTAFWLIVAALMIFSCYSSISAVVKAELFPTEIRALGVGFPYALTVSLFGGTAEYVGLWLKSLGNEGLFFWYVSGCIAVSLVCYIVMSETKSRVLIEAR